ncbi:MAG: hypothetical protein R2715_17185 [Ilumatobacteraceae bacterium]
MAGSGYTVTEFDDDQVTAAELARFDLVLVSSSVVPTTVGDRSRARGSARHGNRSSTTIDSRLQAAGESIAVTGASQTLAIRWSAVRRIPVRDRLAAPFEAGR